MHSAKPEVRGWYKKQMRTAWCSRSVSFSGRGQGFEVFFNRLFQVDLTWHCQNRNGYGLLLYTRRLRPCDYLPRASDDLYFHGKVVRVIRTTSSNCRGQRGAGAGAAQATTSWSLASFLNSCDYLPGKGDDSNFHGKVIRVIRAILYRTDRRDQDGAPQRRGRVTTGFRLFIGINRAAQS